MTCRQGAIRMRLRAPWSFLGISVAANGGCDLLGTGEALPRMHDTIKMLFLAVRQQGLLGTGVVLPAGRKTGPMRAGIVAGIPSRQNFRLLR